MPRSYCLFLISILVIVALLGGCSDEFEPIGDIDPDVPFPVTDLAIATSNDTTYLTWTATGDDGPNGTASRYDLRRHAAMITKENWAEARPFEGLPDPKPAGSRESHVLSVGDGPPAAYMALKVVDDAGNVSQLSNVVFADVSAPGAITDLAAFRVTDSFAALSWTVPADDGPLGHPVRYEVRWSSMPLTEDNWDDVAPANGPTHPAPAGTEHSFTIHRLDPASRYYAGLRCVDEAGNRSGLSNVVEFTTAAEPLGWWPGFEGQTPNGAVRALHVLGDTLYVGGSFVSVGEVATRALAKWDGASWSGYGSALVGGNHGTMVFNMADLGGQLYVGGSIGTAGGAPANNLARWTGTAWESLGVSRTKGYPWSMGVYDGELYVGWVYNMSSTWPFEKLTRYDGTQFHGMGWDEDDSGLAEDMQVHDGKLFMCGGFQTGQGLATAGIIAWDGLEYSTPSSPLSGGYWNEPYPTAMCVYRGDLYVAGEFTHAGGRQVNHIARWDGNAWYPVGAGLSGERPMVHAMTVYRDHLVVAGTFEGAGGQPAANIAMWDGSYWIPLGSGLENDEGFIGVEALAVFQGSLYAGGNFTWAGGHHSPNIARWDFD